MILNKQSLELSDTSEHTAPKHYLFPLHLTMKLFQKIAFLIMGIAGASAVPTEPSDTVISGGNTYSPLTEV